MGRDRRRYPRVGVELDFTLEVSGIRWEGRTIDLSPYGVKVALPANWGRLRPGTSVELKLALPDGGSPLTLTAWIVRTGEDSIALNFVHERALLFARLRDFVDSLLRSASNCPAQLGVSVTGVKDRRRSPRVDAELNVSFDAERPYGWRQSKIVNLSLLGAKVALPGTATQPEWGTAVQMRLASPTGHSPVSVKGVVWRKEPESMAVLFVELGQDQLDRLKTLIESLQSLLHAKTFALVG